MLNISSQQVKVNSSSEIFYFFPVQAKIFLPPLILLA